MGVSRVFDISRRSLATYQKALNVTAHNIEELKNLKWANKSVVAARNLQAGETLTSEKIAFKRPGTGIPVEMAQQIIGRRMAVPLKKDALIEWNKLVDY